MPRKWPASVSNGWLPLVFTSMRENPLLKNSYAMTLPLASIAARARWIEAGPFGSQPVP